VALPEPVPGLVIHYSYLWHREYEQGQEEGVKDRPCAIILVVTDDQGDKIATVLPVTHTPPSDAAFAVEIPHSTKQRLGMDSERSWIMLTEANRFVWPGPDLRISKACDGPEKAAYGLLPRALFKEVSRRFADAIESRATHVVSRTQ
jgi:hypothetical protein